MGALGIERSAGEWLAILQQRVAALRRYNRIARVGARRKINVHRRREASSSQVPAPVRDPLRDPAARARLRVDTASRFGSAAFLPLGCLAPLPARYQPRLGAGLRTRARLSASADREARPDRVHLGVCASPLCRRAFSAAGPQQGRRARAGTPQRARRSCRQPCTYRLFRLAHMVTPRRIVVGAHYGLGSWLAQRITAVIMALYTLVLLIAFMSGRPV